jgi:hypothetical protein
MKTGTLALALFLLTVAGAAADPRSDALAGFSRCQAIADDRVFLDCVYGAMQPMRGKLGLPPAPASQVSLVPPVVLTPSPTPAAPPARTAAPVRNGGMLSGLFGSGRIEVADQPMTGFRFDRQGFFTVTLANGQVWRQVEGDTSLAHWHGVPGSYRVTIRSGALGSFNLQVKGDPSGFKVARVR